MERPFLLKYLEWLVNEIRRLMALLVGQLLISGWIYAAIEDKSYWDGVWWSIVTASTVGYGDQFPTSFAGRSLAIYLMATTVLVIIPGITALLTSQLIVDRDKFSHDEQEELKDGLRKMISLLERLFDEVDENEEIGNLNGRTQAQILEVVKGTDGEVRAIKALLSPTDQPSGT